MANNPFDSKEFGALLDDFIAKQLADTDDALAEFDNAVITDDDDNDEVNNSDVSEDKSVTENDEDDYEQLLNLDEKEPENEIVSALAMEEKRLYNAYSEFVKSVGNLKEEAGIDDELNLSFSAEELLPRFKPTKTDNIKADINACWDIMIEAKYDILKKLSPTATDEQILDFAEKISAPNLQLSLISYVETLIEIDACETAYNLRKAKYQKHKIEKQIFEEQQRINNKKRLFIQAIKDQRFPVDGDLLVNNFFKNARKDPEGAEKVLEQNPATFAPIQIDKIPDHFFGLVKAKPSDGIKINKKMGKYLVKLKV